MEHLLETIGRNMFAIFGVMALAGAAFMIAQILVYAGGIVVLFLFVVMLVELTKYKEQSVFQLQSRYAVVAVLLGAAAFAGVFRKLLFGKASAEALVLRPEITQGLNVAQNNAQAVSRGLFADYLLPFEILSVILLVALVGAVVLAKTERV